MKIKLHKDERIIAVVPEFSAGPGWSNRPMWVYIEQTATRTVRTECIQPSEQTAEMHTLFAPGAAMCAALIATVPVQNLRTFSHEAEHA